LAAGMRSGREESDEKGELEEEGRQRAIARYGGSQWDSGEGENLLFLSSSGLTSNCRLGVIKCRPCVHVPSKPHSAVVQHLFLEGNHIDDGV